MQDIIIGKSCKVGTTIVFECSPGSRRGTPNMVYSIPKTMELISFGQFLTNQFSWTELKNPGASFNASSSSLAMTGYLDTPPSPLPPKRLCRVSLPKINFSQRRILMLKGRRRNSDKSLKQTFWCPNWYQSKWHETQNNPQIEVKLFTQRELVLREY